MGKPKTKELVIPKELIEDEWTSNKVTIKRLTLGDHADLKDETSIPNRLNPSQPMVKMGLSALSALNKSVIKAPWPVNNIQEVRGMSLELSNWLGKEIKEFNELNQKKKMPLEESTAEQSEEPIAEPK